MQANGRSTSMDTPVVQGGIVLLALLGLILLNRVTANVNLSVGK